MKNQSSQNLFMIEPEVFYSNNQTIDSNHYQFKNEDGSLDLDQITDSALTEFNNLKNEIEKHGIKVTFMKGISDCPDHIFPNSISYSWINIISKRFFFYVIEYFLNSFLINNLIFFILTQFLICSFMESLITEISHFSFIIDLILFSASFPPPTIMIFLPSRFRLIIIDPTPLSFYLCIKTNF